MYKKILFKALCSRRVSYLMDCFWGIW